MSIGIPPRGGAEKPRLPERGCDRPGDVAGVRGLRDGFATACATERSKTLGTM